jgi:hypothetical protein
LYWINSSSSSLKTFVSNRVGEIQTNSAPEKWRHVPTEVNPADIATRITKIAELANKELWWKGPSFLVFGKEKWPTAFEAPKEVNDEARSEFKKLFSESFCAISCKLDLPELIKNPKLDPASYSVGRLWDGFERLLNNASLMFKLANKSIEISESRVKAMRFCNRRSQRSHEQLAKVIEDLNEGTLSKASKKFVSLNPFIDKAGIL